MTIISIFVENFSESHIWKPLQTFLKGIKFQGINPFRPIDFLSLRANPAKEKNDGTNSEEQGGRSIEGTSTPERIGYTCHGED
jgi:hypothetical protein